MAAAKVELELIQDLTPLQVGLQSTIDQLTKAVNHLSQVMTTAFTKADAGARKFNDDLKKEATELKNVEKEFTKTNKQIENNTKATKKAADEATVLKNKLDSIANSIKAAFTIDTLVNFAKRVIEVRAEFQRFEAVLTNTLGSKSLAQAALKQIQDFAAQTPFGVAELTASFVKLANQGFEPTIEQMRQLGDIAAAQGKTFDQLTEAIIDAQTGEFERLKEFGIRASKEGSNVTFSFKGVQTQTKFTNDAIREYILSLGELEGVTGGMAAISETLGGQISNLDDNFDALFNNLGKNGEVAFSGFFNLLNKALNETNDMSGRLLRVQAALKDTGFDLGNLEATFTGAAGGIGSFQKILEDTTATAGGFKKEADFVPIYERLNTILRLVNNEFKNGTIDVEEYNRRLILVSTQVITLDEQRNHLLEQQAAAAERAKQKTTDQLREEERLNKLRQKALEDYLKAVEDLAKRVAKSNLDLEKDQVKRVELEQELQLHEINQLQKHFIEIGKTYQANFKLNAEQEAQFGILRNNIRRASLDELIKIEVDKQNELAKAKADAANANAEILALEEQNAINAVNLTPNNGLPEIQFELQKQQRILEIRRDFAIRKLQADQAALLAEKMQQQAAYQGELDLLQGRNDQEAVLKRKQINESLGILEQKFDLENTKLQDEVAIEINGIQTEIEKGIAELNKIPKFDLAKVLGLTPDELALLQTAVSEVQKTIGLVIGSQQELINAQIENNEEDINDYDKKITDLEKRIERETSLKKMGYKNNLDALQQELERDKQLRDAQLKEQEALAEKKKQLAKIQFTTDTIVQASNLITAATSIYAQATATAGPYGVIIGTAAVAAMIGGFLIAKANAFNAIQNPDDVAGFEKGGYTGDKGTKEVAGVVHGQEFVHTAEDTKKHRELFDSIHSHNDNQYRDALIKELIGTGVNIEPDLPNRLENNKQTIRRNETISLKTDNTGMENELREIKAKFDTVLKNQQNTTYTDPAGNLIIKRGNNTTIIKKRN